LLDANARDRLPVRLSHLCGWTPDTPVKRKARAGCAKFWDGAHRSCDTPRSRLPRK
jgi:hypothetical protein